ncbi:tumor necrosis factor receptor superfamily member 14-like [Colossoma macropomum]|uniref:tumor necrosis factor receptor superfamily member 14-like n=1 Tax=Colossoma macropomum TaxID=42526 RepID=UPI001864A651|nr:tumor necrosis factor receptor superfamily member 14-like [Colossoma macropomum]
MCRRNVCFCFFNTRHCTSTLKIISRLEIYFLIAVIFSLNFELYLCTCARAEYEMEDGECCPMCAPGNRVYRHCTEDTSTTCVPCFDSTFIDAPNGLRECFHCTVCDPGRGLRVKTACTRSSDTVCEPLDGYYCTNEHSGSCILAQKHTKCNPGQYIKYRGTAFKDTERAECADGTFSNGSLHICQPHSKCEDLGLTEIKAGTLSTDAECGNKTPAGLIAGIIVQVVVIIAVAVIIKDNTEHKDTCRDNRKGLGK